MRLDLSADEAGRLRDLARAAGVSVDAWLAVMAEFAGSLEVVRRAVGSLDRARGRLSQAVEARPVRIAALPEWRAWQACLGRHAPPGDDELPEVVLPQRLIVRAGGTIDVGHALSAASDWPLAHACELVASGRGQSLEAFVLEAGLAEPAATGR